MYLRPPRQFQVVFHSIYRMEASLESLQTWEDMWFPLFQHVQQLNRGRK